MTFTPRTRLVNPRLGTYFSIFAAAMAALFLLLMIFEQLGSGGSALRLVMLAGPLVLFIVIGVAALTREPLEYFAAGRRVPASYNGLGLAVTAMGATGIVATTGAFFIAGFDALCLMIGGLTGFVVMAVLLAPFLRKFGAYTIPSYLGRRFESRALRVVAAMLVACPMLLVIAAELRIGAHAASLLVQRDHGTTTLLLVPVLLATLFAGGMRSLTWTNVAQAIAAFLALIVPVAIVATIVTNLPLPQLSTGPLVRSLLKQEALQGLPVPTPGLFAFDLPHDGFHAIAKRYTAPFGVIGPAGFVIGVLSVAAGVASAPWLLPRVATAPGVYEARKSLGWATFFFGVVMLTASSVAVFMRDFVSDAAMDETARQLPAWLRELQAMGVVRADGRATRLVVTNVAFDRDSVLFALPIAMGLPAVFHMLALAGAVAAALAAAGAAVVALGNTIAEDVLTGINWEPLRPGPRIHTGRAGLVVAAVGGAAIARLAPSDPLELMLWAFALSGATLFPVLVLSIWWKRLNGWGAIAGLATGFAVTAMAMIAGKAGWSGLDGALAGVFGIPAATISALVVSVLTPPPSKHVMELVRDIRVPGGEILYDREMRLARLKQRQNS